MSSDLRDKKSKGVLYSFKYALEGILHGVISERNLKIHTVIAVIVILFGFLFKISSTEWMFIVIAIGGVYSLELMNTAIERIVDHVSPQYHPLAKQAKDVAAGAVLIYACMSVIIGCIIFIPKIL
ncbi:diacylglycerol kinase family protein [Niallia sp. Krafla_26]|uniref:diacylglycerol kinase family protein n=1 Tax=Niallia sp. Krafla_26 TaxID=3064703 RepID=UPI003D17E51D